jgi:AcrR family transcriptional regulator
MMEETQERLLDTAAQLFARRGFAGVSMRDIASAVGITQAAIYHHFANKDALYIGAITYLFEKLTLGIGDQMAAIEEPHERLELLTATMLGILEEDPRFRRIYMRELLEGDEDRLAALAENTFAAFYEPLYTLMGELAPGRDPQLLIFSLFGMVFHHLEARKLGPHLPHSKPQEHELPALATHITQLFLYGIGPT